VAQPPPDPEPAAPVPAEPPAEPEPAAPVPAEPAPEKPAPPPTKDTNEGADDAPKEGPGPELDPDPGPQPAYAEMDPDKRPTPDYDGRGDDPTTAGDVLIWIPRGLFFPVYLVSEYVIRWPLGKVTSALDEADIPGILSDFFTFGPGDNYGLVPSFLIDFGFRPSIGVYFFGDDVGNVKGLGIRSHLAFGGIDFYRGTATVRYTLEEASRDTSEKLVQVKGVYSHRPDWRFYGVGPDSLEDDFSRYGRQDIIGRADYEGGFWRSSRLRVWGGVQNTDFKNINCCDDLPIRDMVARGRYPMPDLFDAGYFTGFGGAEVSLDTRKVRLPPNLEEGSDFVSPTGSGIKIDLRGEAHGGITDTPETPTSRAQRLAFIRYGGTVGGFLDVYKQRVFGLQFIVDFADPLTSESQIPFTELASLGGSRPMRGFLQNRLLGRSSAVAEIEYRWPIWVFLDGLLNYSVGNVFGKHLEGFEMDRLRQSFGFGFSAAGARDHPFELLLGLGTQTFEQGSSIDTFRFVFGSSTGF
jgi:hypothetical protein